MKYSRPNLQSNVILSVSDLRKEYSSKGLLEEDLPLEPYSLFHKWFQEACDAKVLEPNAMCLSTCQNNIPSARYVLLKGYDETGFCWYTNYESRKANDLDINPYAALTFWWGDLERQIRIEGLVEKVSENESTTYFNSRPRGSQIGAWSSSQSQVIENRQKLEIQESNIQLLYQDINMVIPKPTHWGGYRLKPTKIEFWKGRQSRLHDRIVYEYTGKEEDEVKIEGNSDAVNINNTDITVNKYMSNVNNWIRSRLQP